METERSNQEIVKERSLGRGSGERTYRRHVLGSSGCVTSMNSFAPFDGFASSSSDASSFLAAESDELGDDSSFCDAPESEPTFLQDPVRLIPSNKLRSVKAWGIARRRQVTSGRKGVRLSDLSGSDPLTTMRQSLELPALTQQVLTLGEPAVVFAITLAKGVEAWGEASGVLPEARIVARLCLDLVPKARRVVVSLAHDPEVHETGLTFTVFTSASVEAVVAAEDNLHEMLFREIPAPRLTNRSIAYEFVG
jgi:hypothetical protein